MSLQRTIATALMAVALLYAGTAFAANTIKLKDPLWFGNFPQDKIDLKKIKKAVEQALTGPVDAEYQCGEVYLDCVARAVREWEYKGEKYREIVVNVHTVGHVARTVHTSGGKWPKVVIQ